LTDYDLQLMVYRNGPTFVAIGAAGDFFSYKGGVYRGECADSINHGVLLYGWDDESWHMQNSWGEGWGYGGHFYLPRGENKCGVQLEAANVIL